MGNSTKWKEIFFFREDGPRLLEAHDLAIKIQDSFKKFGAPIKIKKRDYSPIVGDGFVFQFKPKDGVRIENVKKRLIDVQYSLNLSYLRFSRVNGILCLETFTPQAVELNNSLKSVLESGTYKTAVEQMTIAHPIGINDSGQPFIYDLAKYPNALISGTTLSGKTSALKSLLVTLSKYPSEKINLLIADYVAELVMFEKLPHLSASRIRTPEDFVSMFLLLAEEVKRRLWLKENEPKTLEKLPYIVCIIDEFPSFMGDLKEPQLSEVSKIITAKILRYSRHTRIHLVLSIHEPILEIAKIRLDDIPAKLEFRAGGSRKTKSVDSADEGERDGELRFKYRNISTRLQGYYIDDAEIPSELPDITSTFTTKDGTESDILPRGKYGFTITVEDLERKKEEVSASLFSHSSVSITNKNKSDDKATRVKAILGALRMEAVSANLIEGICGVATDKAKEIYEYLYSVGLLGEFNRYKQRKVIPQSIDEVPMELRTLLSEYSISDAIIENAIAERHGSNKD